MAQWLSTCFASRMSRLNPWHLQGRQRQILLLEAVAIFVDNIDLDGPMA